MGYLQQLKTIIMTKKSALLFVSNEKKQFRQIDGYYQEIYEYLITKLYDDGYRVIFVDIEFGLRIHDSKLPIEIIEVVEFEEEEVEQEEEEDEHRNKESYFDDLFIIKKPYEKNIYVMANCRKIVTVSAEQLHDKFLITESDISVWEHILNKLKLYVNKIR